MIHHLSAKSDEAHYSSFDSVLMKLSKEILRKDLAALKFLCMDEIPASIREDIHTFMAFLRELENLDLYNVENLSFLSELLFRIGRRDLARLLDKENCKTMGYRTPLSQFRIFLHLFGAEIPQNELHAVQFWFRHQLSRQAVMDVWSLFDALEMVELLTPEDLSPLYTIADTIGRVDLKVRIDDYKAGKLNLALRRPAETERQQNPGLNLVNNSANQNRRQPEDRKSSSEDCNLHSEMSTFQTTSNILDNVGNKALNHNVGAPNSAHENISIYPMTSCSRGSCIIINIDKFKQESDDRPGSKKDAEKLKKTFQNLGFKVDIHPNPSTRGIKKILKITAESEPERVSALVVCILSHGGHGFICGSDGECVKIDEIKGYFTPDNCPNLAGKPKVFLIQACQGPHEREACIIKNHNGTAKTLDADADFFIGFATLPGCVAYRHVEEGSWYINSLVDNLNKYSSRHDFLSIMTSVTNDVASKIRQTDSAIYKQVPLPYTTLTKRLYLWPSMNRAEVSSS